MSFQPWAEWPAGVLISLGVSAVRSEGEVLRPYFPCMGGEMPYVLDVGELPLSVPEGVGLRGEGTESGFEEAFECER